MFIVLHFADTGKVVSVNSRTIREFDEGPAVASGVPAHGARIVFAANHAILVQETPMEIMAKVPEDQLPSDASLLNPNQCG